MDITSLSLRGLSSAELETLKAAILADYAANGFSSYAIRGRNVRVSKDERATLLALVANELAALSADDNGMGIGVVEFYDA